MAAKPPRTARQVIDQAIRENRVSEWLLYAFATVFVCTGVFAVIFGVIYREGIVAVGGGIAGALFYPAIRLSQSIRRENMAIRLLEEPLNRAETAEEAARAIREHFARVFEHERV
jgi:hypothetical protein